MSAGGVSKGGLIVGGVSKGGTANTVDSVQKTASMATKEAICVVLIIRSSKLALLQNSLLGLVLAHHLYGKGSGSTIHTSCRWLDVNFLATEINNFSSCHNRSFFGSTTPKSKYGRNLSAGCVKKRTKNQNAINGGIQPHL
jgi:hypothetical protein